MKDQVFFATTGFLIGILFFSGLYWVSGYLQENKVRFAASGQLSCDSDAGFLDNVKCLNDDLLSWYRYNDSNIDKYWNQAIDWEMLFNEGGVCWHASKYYVGRAKEIGLGADMISFYGEKKIGHSIAVVYPQDLSMYCIVDQGKVVGCQVLDSGGRYLDV